MSPNEMVDAPEILTVQRAAKRLGIAPRRLRAAVRHGDLAAFRPGSRWLYVTWPDVLSWLRKQRVVPSHHARERAAEIISEDNQRKTAAG
jgi:excisionase family DNA binding protein